MTVETNEKLKTVELYFSGYILNYIQRFVRSGILFPFLPS